MRKIDFIICGLLCVSNILPCLSQALDEGNKHQYAGVSVGLNTYYKSIPFGFMYEYGVRKNISVGGILDVNYGSYPSTIISTEKWAYKASYLGIRSSYHFERLKKNNMADLYIGIGTGFQYFKWKDSSFGKEYSYKNGFSMDYFIGGKFRLMDITYLSVEAGNIGMSNLRLGLCLKIW